jgi:hypothetical protein
VKLFVCVQRRLPIITTNVRPFVPLPEYDPTAHYSPTNTSAVTLRQAMSYEFRASRDCVSNEDAAALYLINRHTCRCGQAFSFSLQGHCGEQKYLGGRCKSVLHCCDLPDTLTLQISAATTFYDFGPAKLEDISLAAIALMKPSIVTLRDVPLIKGHVYLLAVAATEVSNCERARVCVCMSLIEPRSIRFTHRL